MYFLLLILVLHHVLHLVLRLLDREAILVFFVNEPVLKALAARGKVLLLIDLGVQ